MSVSILIPTFNRKEFLIQAIECCLKQTYRDIKIIIYDDGSTDGTHLAVDKYVNDDLTLPVTYIRSGVNRGIGYARSKLLESFDSEYACWLDSDDLMHPERISKCINAIGDADIMYSNIQHFTQSSGNKHRINKGVESRIDTNRYQPNNVQCLTNNTACATAFFKNKIKGVKMLDSLTLGAEDVLWLYTLLHLGYVVGHINEPLYYYRSHDKRITTLKKLDINLEQKTRENKLIGDYIDNITTQFD